MKNAHLRRSQPPHGLGGVARSRSLFVATPLSLVVVTYYYVTKVAPTPIIFVPSINGRSYVEAENTTWDDCEAGANVSLQCLLNPLNKGRTTGSDHRLSIR
jgi:hypothetical protein